ncbi:hypothetical protein K443DRAFT_13020 [Laccaria amethystina LaAM-08-1]|uniref:Uncharacterized protein n=1 Tax=Laccaria amethystina LaAM-08-1 TaxID=1095629 RepID=A0A0C9X6E1_9AGAR|nr:hypothetical protein K443DRAFT_13020 [Laccaria amethystina LaAM-08-1]
MQTFQVITDSSWQLITKSATHKITQGAEIQSQKQSKNVTGSFVPAQGSKVLASTLKRKAEDDLKSDEPKSKKSRASFGPTPDLWVWASALHGMYESFLWISNAEQYLD